jgi:chloramphenicol-sensitive protein RarD
VPAVSSSRPAPPDPDASRGFALALVAYGVWGLLPLYWKLVESISAAETTAVRVVATAALVGPLVLWGRPGRGVRRLVADRRALRLHALTAGLLGANWLTYVWAVNNDRVVETSLGYFINPLINVVLGVVVLGERLPRRQWAAVALAAVGVGVLTLEAGTVPWVALILAASFGFYGLQRKTSPLASLDGLSVEMGWLVVPATAALGFLALTGRATVGDELGPTVALVGAGVATAVPLLAFAGAARRIPLSALGLMQYLAPSLQFGIGVLIFGESVSRLRLAGFAVVWAALVVFALDTTRAAVRQRTLAARPPDPVAAVELPLQR